MKREDVSLRRAAVLCVIALVACRTGRPAGKPVAPIVATSAQEAMQQLRERRTAFTGMKSLMRIRATTSGKTQSFRAQLVVHDTRRMDLIAYTPVGTTAMTMHIEGDTVKVKNHLENTEWEGGARDLPEPFKFLSASFGPTDIALLTLGFPLPGGDRPGYGILSDATPQGLRAVQIGSAMFTFSPPSFPAKNVVFTLANERVEIEHLEVVSE